MNIYVSWEAEQLEGLTATAMLSDNASELRHLSSDFERAANDLKQWAMANGGSVIMDLTTKGCITVPPEKASDMTDVQAKFEEVTNNSIAIGMGMTISESHTALRHSKLHGHKISLYTPEMEQDVINDDSLLGKSELRKDDAPEAPPADVQPSSEGAGMGQSPEDAQAETGQAPAGSNVAPGQVQAAPQGSGATNIDEAERQKEAASGSGGEDPKAMIMSALQEVKANSGAIEKLKTTAPAAYAAVKDVVQAMITMAESMAKAEGDEDFEYLDKAIAGPFNASDPSHLQEANNLKNHIINRNKTEPSNAFNDWAHIGQTYNNGRGIPVQHLLDGVPHATFQSLNWPDKKVHVTQGPEGGYMLYENADGTLEGINFHTVHADGSHPNNPHDPAYQDVIHYEKEQHPKVQRYREIQRAIEEQEAKQRAEEEAERQRQEAIKNGTLLSPEQKARIEAEKVKPGGGVFGSLGQHAVSARKPAPTVAPAPKRNIYGSEFNGPGSPFKSKPTARPAVAGLTGNDKVMSDYHTKLAGEREAATQVADQEIKEGGGK